MRLAPALLSYGVLAEAPSITNFLFHVAMRFVALGEWHDAANPDEARQVHREIKVSAARLLKAIEDAPSRILQELDYNMIQPGKPFALRSDQFDPLGFADPVPLVDYLKALLANLDKEVVVKRGPPPRYDLIYLAAAGGDLWSALTGKRFPKNLVRGAGLDRDKKFSVRPEDTFGTESAVFAGGFVRAFFPTVGRSQLVAALKGIKVIPKS